MSPCGTGLDWKTRNASCTSLCAAKSMGHHKVATLVSRGLLFSDRNNVSGHCCPTRTSFLAVGLSIGAMFQCSCGFGPSPAGRAPTLLNRIVGARPAGDCRNQAHHYGAEFIFVGQQWCQVYFSTETNKPDTFFELVGERARRAASFFNGRFDITGRRNYPECGLNHFTEQRTEKPCVKHGRT